MLPFVYQGTRWNNHERNTVTKTRFTLWQRMTSATTYFSYITLHCRVISHYFSSQDDWGPWETGPTIISLCLSVCACRFAWKRMGWPAGPASCCFSPRLQEVCHMMSGSELLTWNHYLLSLSFNLSVCIYLTIYICINICTYVSTHALAHTYL